MDLSDVVRHPEKYLSGNGQRDGGAAEAGAELLDAVAEFIGRYVACSPAGRDVGALWVLHTHAFDAADASPRLAFLSSEPQSGKSRYLEVLKLVVRSPLFAVNISEAALFRVIEARRPTILHDEIDAVLGPKARDREDLRGMLNAGYERGANVERCVGDGAKMTVKPFAVFAPVALAGLGKLPETLEQRSIVVRMKRRTADEPVAKLRRRHVADEVDILRAQAEAWATANVPALSTVDPEMPEELSDRAQDIWEPLLAIADLAGGDWPTRARDAARELFSARRDDESTIGVRLLADIRDAFAVDEGLASGELATRLAHIEGAPWAEWTGRDKTPLTAHGLAKLLRRYDIKPRQHRIGDHTFRGYVRDDFTDSWDRYLPSPEKCNTGESATPQAQQGQDLLHSDPCCTSPGRGAPGRRHHPRLEALADELDAGVATLEERLADLDRDHEEYHQHVADLRAADVLRRRRANEEAPTDG